MTVTNEQNILLSVIGSAVRAQPVTLPAQSCDWSEVAKEAKQQAVGLLFLDAISEFQDKLPEDVYAEASRIAMAITGSNMRVGFSQAELIRRMDANGFPYVILKGEAAASYYPQPQLRNLGDVDFLIDPTQRAQISAMLVEAGFTPSHQGHICHEVFRKPGAHLEMHFQVAGVPNGRPGELVTEYLQDALTCVQEKDIGSGCFCAPADRHHGLILLLHMQHHMLGEGIGLRHLCDWACFVDQTWQKPFWQEDLLPKLRQIGLLTYASVMTKTAAIYFGTACPDWAQTDEGLCREIMEDILTSGNFGRKDDTRAISAYMVSNRGKDGTQHGKIYYLYKTLYASTLEAHPNLKNKPLLIPFCMVGRAIRYLFLVAKGERHALHKLVPQADGRRSMYSKLHLFEV